MGGVNGALFLKQLDEIIADGAGFKKVVEGIGITSLRDADGIIPTASTEPSVEALETNFDGVVVSASQTDLGSLAFMVPRDFDADKDYMAVRFLCNSGGTTNAPTIDAVLYRKRAGAVLSSDLNPTISAACSKTSATTGTGWIEVVASGLDLNPGDALTWIFTTSAHTTDALNVYALEVEYYSDLVYNDRDDRA